MSPSVNDALGDSDLGKQTVEDLCRNIASVPEDIRGAVRNNGGGHANHSLFWTSWAPRAAASRPATWPRRSTRELGGFDKFKEDFTKAAATRFGSGWAWLSVDKAGKLVVESTPNQDNPYMNGRTPILGVDVWEHAYYLNYQNRRPDYVAAFFNVINWDAVGKRYAAAKG